MKLCRNLFALSTLALPFTASAAVISVDVHLSGKSDVEFVSTPTDHEITREAHTDITPVDAILDYQVDFDGARAAGLEVSLFDSPDYASYHVSLPLEGLVPVGPFHSELMSMVDTSAYSDTWELGELFINSGFTKNPTDPNGFEGIQISYQITGQESNVEGGIETLESYTYFNYFYMPLATVNLFEDLTLTSLDAIEQALLDNQGGGYIFGEQLHIQTETYDASTFEWLGSTGRTIDYYGTASYSVTTSVPEPGVFSLMLLGMGGLLIRRKR